MDSVGRRKRFIERRKLVGLTQESLAYALEVSVSSIAQWERGITSPTARHRRKLAAALEVGLHDLDHLLDPNAAPHGVQGHLVPPWLEHWVSLEQAAGEIRTVETLTVPGLLQTRAYAEATMRANFHPLDSHQIATRVGLRMSRQDALTRRDDPVHLRVVIDESILARMTGTPLTMADQLDRLLVVAEQTNIELRVLPLTDVAHAVSFGSFWLLVKPGATEPFMLCSENATTVNYSEVPLLLDDHRRLFDHLEGVSQSPRASIARISAARKSYR